jgi:4-hydroxy-tetrahydrodipicolinate synthase
MLGVIPVLTTPILKDGQIDTQSLRRLIELLITKEVGGLWVLGTGSEDMNLTFKKRIEVAEIVAETNAGRIPIIVGAGFFAMEDTLTFIKEIQVLDIDAIHVMPYHPLLSLDRMDWYYRHIADNCSKPLWMYTSANWARPISQVLNSAPGIQ